MRIARPPDKSVYWNIIFFISHPCLEIIVYLTNLKMAAVMKVALIGKIWGSLDFAKSMVQTAVFLFTDNNRQQPKTNLQLPTTTVNDPDQTTASIVWLIILFTRSAKNSSGMKVGSAHAPVNGGPVFPGTFLEHFGFKNYILTEFLLFSTLSYIVLAL